MKTATAGLAQPCFNHGRNSGLIDGENQLAQVRMGLTSTN